MRVVQVVPRIKAESSGPSYSVPALCDGLARNACEVTLAFVGAFPKRDVPCEIINAPISRFPHPRLGRSPRLLQALKVAVAEAQIIHNNSLWMFPNVYPAMALNAVDPLHGRCKLVTAPRGTLSGWSLKHHSLQKKLFGWYAQYAALRATDMWHATCEKEYEEIRAAGFRQPVAIVPIGMEIPSGAETARPRNGEKRTVAFFGRIHKVKAVDSLVLSWEKASARHPAWELVVAGPDGGMVEILKAIIAERKIANVRFTGEINGAAKYAFLSSVDLYVLPSHTENFGVTVAEALACGTPVIASKHTPWGGVVENRCGWCVSNDVGTLAATLDEAMSLPQEMLKGMGVRGREWIRRDFSWRGVGQRMKQSYEWLLNPEKVERPEWVRVD